MFRRTNVFPLRRHARDVDVYVPWSSRRLAEPQTFAFLCFASSKRKNLVVLVHSPAVALLRLCSLFEGDLQTLCHCRAHSKLRCGRAYYAGAAPAIEAVHRHRRANNIIPPLVAPLSSFIFHLSALNEFCSTAEEQQRGPILPSAPRPATANGRRPNGRRRRHHGRDNDEAGPGPL